MVILPPAATGDEIVDCEVTWDVRGRDGVVVVSSDCDAIVDGPVDTFTVISKLFWDAVFDVTLDIVTLVALVVAVAIVAD